MILTIPLRLITLHLSHIFFTEGRTFILMSPFAGQSPEKFLSLKLSLCEEETNLIAPLTEAFALRRLLVRKINTMIKRYATHI